MSRVDNPSYAVKQKKILSYGKNTNKSKGEIILPDSGAQPNMPPILNRGHNKPSIAGLSHFSKKNDKTNRGGPPRGHQTTPRTNGFDPYPLPGTKAPKYKKKGLR